MSFYQLINFLHNKYVNQIFPFLVSGLEIKFLAGLYDFVAVLLTHKEKREQVTIFALKTGLN